jgi:hypothetical protein
MTAEIIAAALGGHRTGVAWMARRSVHDDCESSLSIRGTTKKSTWWRGAKDGRFPKPVKLGLKTTAWRVEDIRALIERGR